MDGQLIPLETVNGVELFTGVKLDELLAAIRKEAATIVPDLLTVGGRKEIASMAYKVARSKTTIDDAGKDLVSVWKKQSAEVDAARKKARDYLDALRDEVRKPLDDWEAEQARIEREAVEKAAVDREAIAEAERVELAQRLADVAAREAVIAAKEKEAADKLAAEVADAARLVREEAIRVEAITKAERAASDALMKAKNDAARENEAALLAAVQARHKSDEALAQAERDKVAAVRQAEEAAERKDRARLADEARVKAEDEKRAANKRHCAAINNAVITGLMIHAGISQEVAKAIVIAIATGKVSHTSITY